MDLNDKEQDSIRLYLLGQLPEEDSARLEERLLSDTDFLQEILIGEDELIDRRLGNKLSESEREAFETRFLLSRERQQKLRFARNLKKYVGKEAAATEATTESSGERSHDFAAAPAKKRNFFSLLPTANPILAYSLTAVIVLAVVGISWVAIKNLITPQTEPGNVLAVVLTPGLTRDGGEVTRFNLPSEIDRVAFRLVLQKSEYQTYRAVLLAEDRSQVWESDDLVAVNDAGTMFVLAIVPARLLPNGDYRIKISGQSSAGSFEDLATYPFQVIRLLGR